ncbi:uncharacterized protein Tco025E_09395, partial [Trypanosoma conorhini]
MTTRHVGDFAVTIHRVQFNGDDWAVLLERNRAALCEALDTDVCGAVGVPRGSVVDVEFTLGSLFATFSLRYLPSLRKSDVDKRLAQCDFAEMWKLYDGRDQLHGAHGAMPAAVPLAAKEEMFPVLLATEERDVTPLKLQSPEELSPPRGDGSCPVVKVLKPPPGLLGKNLEEGGTIPLETAMTTQHVG